MKGGFINIREFECRTLESYTTVRIWTGLGSGKSRWTIKIGNLKSINDKRLSLTFSTACEEKRWSHMLKNLRKCKKKTNLRRVQGLPSAFINSRTLKLWIFVFKFKDFQVSYEPWYMKRILRQSAPKLLLKPREWFSWTDSTI